VWNKNIKIRYSTDTVTNIFTKALPYDKHLELSEMTLGMNTSVTNGE